MENRLPFCGGLAETDQCNVSGTLQEARSLSNELRRYHVPVIARYCGECSKQI